LAKELKIKTTELIKKAAAINIEIKSNKSIVPANEANRLRNYLN
jgi:hypothetical protein